MMIRLITATAAVALASGAANAADILHTDLPVVNGAAGVGGTATTVTDANGRTTTVSGPAGDANRYYDLTPPIQQWHQSALGGGGTVGITKTYTNDGDGAAYFASTSATGASKGDLIYLFQNSISLSAITSVSYDWFVDPVSNTTNGSYSPVMRLLMTKDGAYAGHLILEHYYQASQPSPEGVWTTESATASSGVFWTSNAALGPTFAAAGGVKTLAQWIADNGKADLQVVGLNIGFGSGWEGTLLGAIDNVSFGTAAGTTSFNFKVANAVPEPATWAMMIGGFALAGAAMRRRVRTVSFA